ncbi:hypothetical protein GCM10010273_64570 [Streptomyces lavendulocolor]|jgi:hypothetical protein
MGEFLFFPASSPASGINGTLHGRGAAIYLTWSGAVLQELAETMEDLEKAFTDSWSRAGLSTKADGGRTRVHKHA